MGFFSWCYADTDGRMIIGKRQKSFLLVPPPFQDIYGKAIVESYYDGYGNMGGV